MPKIASIEVFPLTIPRDTPYLGPLAGATTDASNKGLFVRPGNRTVYSIHDHSVLVKVTDDAGNFGWGECAAVVAPLVHTTILRELVAPLVLGRDPHAAVAIYDDLYDAMRVRGYFGGFYHDALAAIDIALWDLRGKLTGLPICQLLGATRQTRIPAYVSGLPRETRADRAALAREWVDRGFAAVKFAAVVAYDGEEAEIRSIREAIGPRPHILADMHWRYTAPAAIQVISAMEPYGLYAAEAPVEPEDVEGLAQVARAVKTPVCSGEELRTVYEYRPRFERQAMSIIQPEMGRTGITEFVRICHLAQAYHCQVMPHASIGIGIFQAASLHVAATLRGLPYHEYQHSIFDKNLRFVTGDMRCEAGYFHVPTGPGLGVEPNAEAFKHLISG